MRTTTPQAPLASRNLFAGSGKVWGGSGSVNAMIVLRGDIHDYLRWQHIVDPHFRVWGIDNLRVVDASVIPEASIVNIHAPVLALAELATDLMGFAPHHC